MIVDIETIERIKESTFGESLLVKTHTIIDSPFGWGGCKDLTRTIYMLYPNSDKNNSFLLQAKNNTEEYFELCESAYKKEHTDYGICFVHNSFYEKSSYTADDGVPIDLGLSVLWADKNVGATTDSDYGILFGYGDISGEITAEDESAYPAFDLVNTENDIAKSVWGNGWRMPTTEEIKELCDQCKWKKTIKNGVAGSLITGPNGNSVFFPFAGCRMGINTYRRGEWGNIWSGTMSNFNSPVEMFFDNLGGSINYGASAKNGNSVRPVKDK